MENFYIIYFCDQYKFRVYINFSNPELVKKFQEINRNQTKLNKFILVIEAVKAKIANKTQFNWELSTPIGEVYAIKIDEHRFYTLAANNGNYRELFICRYGRKQSQQNDKKLTTTIESISKISIQKVLQ